MIAISSDGHYTSIDGYITSNIYCLKATQISPWHLRSLGQRDGVELIWGIRRHEKFLLPDERKKG
jgi:hypothetical protein